MAELSDRWVGNPKMAAKCASPQEASSRIQQVRGRRTLLDRLDLDALLDETATTFGRMGRGESWRGVGRGVAIAVATPTPKRVGRGAGMSPRAERATSRPEALGKPTR